MTEADGIEQLVKMVANLKVNMDQGFKRMEQKFEDIDQRFESIDQRFEAIDQKFEAMEQRFDKVDNSIVELKENQEKILNSIEINEEDIRNNRLHIQKIEKREQFV